MCLYNGVGIEMRTLRQRKRAPDKVLTIPPSAVCVILFTGVLRYTLPGLRLAARRTEIVWFPRIPFFVGPVHT